MDILLVTATALEMRAVLAGLSPAVPGAEAENVTDENALLPSRMTAGGHTLHPLVCGIGPVNAAFALGQRLGLPPAPPKSRKEQGSDSCLPIPPFAGVINMGVAGTYDLEKAPVGSVIAATEEVWPEYGLAGTDGVQADGLGFAQAECRDKRIFDRISLSPRETLDKLGLAWPGQLLLGSAVTVAGCSGVPEQAARLKKRTGGLFENMEGFALALGCLHYAARQDRTGPGEEPDRQNLSDLPFVEIRSISNLTGCRPPLTWDLPAALAALGQAARQLFIL